MTQRLLHGTRTCNALALIAGVAVTFHLSFGPFSKHVWKLVAHNPVAEDTNVTAIPASIAIARRSMDFSSLAEGVNSSQQQPVHQERDTSQLGETQEQIKQLDLSGVNSRHAFKERLAEIEPILRFPWLGTHVSAWDMVGDTQDLRATFCCLFHRDFFSTFKKKHKKHEFFEWNSDDQDWCLEFEEQGVQTILEPAGLSNCQEVVYGFAHHAGHLSYWQYAQIFGIPWHEGIVTTWRGPLIEDPFAYYSYLVDIGAIIFMAGPMKGGGSTPIQDAKNVIDQGSDFGFSYFLYEIGSILCNLRLQEEIKIQTKAIYWIQSDLTEFFTPKVKRGLREQGILQEPVHEEQDISQLPEIQEASQEPNQLRSQELIEEPMQDITEYGIGFQQPQVQEPMQDLTEYGIGPQQQQVQKNQEILQSSLADDFTPALQDELLEQEGMQAQGDLQAQGSLQAQESLQEQGRLQTQEIFQAKENLQESSKKQPQRKKGKKKKGKKKKGKKKKAKTLREWADSTPDLWKTIEFGGDISAYFKGQKLAPQDVQEIARSPECKKLIESWNLAKPKEYASWEIGGHFKKAGNWPDEQDPREAGEIIRPSEGLEGASQNSIIRPSEGSEGPFQNSIIRPSEGLEGLVQFSINSQQGVEKSLGLKQQHHQTGMSETSPTGERPKKF